MSRTRTKPDDLLDIIDRLSRRISAIEASQRIGFTSFESGAITMISDIPEIDMYPLGPDQVRRASLYAYDFGGAGDPEGTAVTLLIEALLPNGDLDSAGGKVLFWTESAVLSHNPHAQGGEESYVWLGDGGLAGRIDIQGFFNNQFQTSPQQAIYSGSFSTGAGFTSFTHTYFEAFASEIVPICTLLNSAGALTWNLTAQSTSSFTVAWSGTLTKIINFWNVRL